jgi:CheY-like chemotaxis protein
MGNRLLLADDSITIQKVVAIIFANEEFELTVVDNGSAALDKAREIQPDVMLVDALMPGKTGYEVCTEIRRDPKLASVPILLLIGAFEPLDEDKAKSCGADATISKPFESQQLIDKVKELLEAGKTRKAAAPAAAAAQVAQPEPTARGAEDLWGDLSALDTMAPSAAAPAAAQPALQPAQPAQPAQAAPERAQAAPQPAPAAPSYAAPTAPAPQEEILEATLEDDLWGAFELEEEEEAPAAAPSEVFGVVEPESEFEAEQYFTFEDDEAIAETGPALDLVEEPMDLPAAEPEPEELFGFEEEVPAAAAAQPAEPEPFQLPDYEPFSLEEEPTELEPFAPEPVEPEPIEPAATAWAETAPSPHAAAPQAAAAPQPAVATAAPAAGAAPTLSEEALVEAISKISKEVIERIVWEVVPDLAEVLIKEEIRKLRAGTKG